MSYCVVQFVEQFHILSYFVVMCRTVPKCVKASQAVLQTLEQCRLMQCLGRLWICNTPTQLDVNGHYFHRAGSGCCRFIVARDIASNDNILEREASARQSYADSSTQLQTMALGGVAVDALRLTDSVALASQRAAGAQKFHQKHQQVSTPHFSGSVMNSRQCFIHCTAHRTPLHYSNLLHSTQPTKQLCSPGSAEARSHLTRH